MSSTKVKRQMIRQGSTGFGLVVGLWLDVAHMIMLRRLHHCEGMLEFHRGPMGYTSVKIVKAIMDFIKSGLAELICGHDNLEILIAHYWINLQSVVHRFGHTICVCTSVFGYENDELGELVTRAQSSQ